MKKSIQTIMITVAVLFVFIGSSFTDRFNGSQKIPAPDDLYHIMYALDQRFFNAYNACDLVTQSELLADDIEFYHDQGGLSTSKEAILKATAENICGKVTRVLVPQSLEVSPIAGYGAAVMGLHKFKNSTQPVGTESKASRFVALWKETDGTWQMTRIISLH